MRFARSAAEGVVGIIVFLFLLFVGLLAFLLLFGFFLIRSRKKPIEEVVVAAPEPANEPEPIIPAPVAEVF